MQGDAEASTTAAAAAAAAGDLGLARRLPAGALPPRPSPHPLSPQDFAPELAVSARAGREGDGRGGTLPRGRIRALVRLIGTYLSNRGYEHANLHFDRLSFYPVVIGRRGKWVCLFVAALLANRNVRKDRLVCTGGQTVQ